MVYLELLSRQLDPMMGKGEATVDKCPSLQASLAWALLLGVPEKQGQERSPHCELSSDRPGTCTGTAQFWMVLGEEEAY